MKIALLEKKLQEASDRQNSLEKEVIEWEDKYDILSKELQKVHDELELVRIDAEKVNFIPRLLFISLSIALFCFKLLQCIYRNVQMYRGEKRLQIDSNCINFFHMAFVQTD